MDQDRGRRVVLSSSTVDKAGFQDAEVASAILLTLRDVLQAVFLSPPTASILLAHPNASDFGTEYASIRQCSVLLCSLAASLALSGSGS